MDEWDKIIRRKVSGLDTPPPGTGWQPARGWEKLQGQLKPVRPLRPVRRWTWYHAAAAAFVILLVPFAVMLADIYRQQAQINRLSAQLARTRPAVPQPLPAPPAGRTAPEAPPPLVRATAVKPAGREKRKPAPATPVPGTAHATRQPAAVPAPESEATRLAQEPVPAVPGAVVEAANMAPPAPGGDSEARLLRLVGTSPKREATSVTIVFQGTGPGTDGLEVMASTTDPAPGAPRRRLLRAFGGVKREENLSATPEPSRNILSLLNKHQ
jgi:hypothetical protein